MSDVILVLNAGSSSLKFSLFSAHAWPQRGGFFCEGACKGIGHRVHFAAQDANGTRLAEEDWTAVANHEDVLAELLPWLARRFPAARLRAAGHRIVHGGALYRRPVRLDAEVIRQLTGLIPLAPLHQPHPLAAIAALAKLHPSLPQIACFDTAFHATQPELATAFALPQSLAAEGVRRYGFHGLSYEYIASELPDVVGAEIAVGRVIVAHLGSGASLCAMRHGKSIATTMGFTPLDGLVMSQRCGSLDPGVVLYLMQTKGMDAAAISDLLYHRSGLLGVSGISDDMQALLASSDSRAAEAVALFVYRVGREIGSLAAALGGLDALVFTAGIGEHAAEIRRRVCEGAGWLGLSIDHPANEHGGPRLSRPESRVSAWVIPTDEELMIARHTIAVMRGIEEEAQ